MKIPIWMGIIGFLAGCSMHAHKEHVIVNPEYQIITEETLFQEKNRLKITEVSFSDHPGVMHLPDVRVSLLYTHEKPTIVEMSIVIDEIMEITGIRFNVDGDTYNIQRRNVDILEKGEGGYDRAFGQFILSAELLEVITNAKNTVLQIFTDSGSIDKVFFSGTPTIVQDSFRSLLTEIDKDRLSRR